MTSLRRNDGTAIEVGLEIFNPSKYQAFKTPTKEIQDGADVQFFLTSLAYRDIMTFTLQLNRSVVPRILDTEDPGKIQTFELGSDAIHLSPPVRRLQDMIQKLQTFVDEAPPDTGPRRFGNVSFRKWYKLVEDRATSLLAEFVPIEVLSFKSSTIEDGALEELRAYFLGSFGSPQRLDYGTGHELSFLTFLAAIWKLGGFQKGDAEAEGRGIVLGVFETYFRLVRMLITTYTLEPAGSHGVWGLDDNSFLPYIFGSAQLSAAMAEGQQTPTEGSLPDAPDASSIIKPDVVEKERKRNMYFSAIGNIYDVKRGPFWEHSPVLYDISGIRAGWAKINKGMIKMYNAEVLSKFPVVQHFPFGSLFLWEKDPDARMPPSTTHTVSQSLRSPQEPGATGSVHGSMQVTAFPETTAKAPVGIPDGVTRAPWASQPSSLPLADSRSGPRFARPQRPGDVPLPSRSERPTKAPLLSRPVQPPREDR